MKKLIPIFVLITLIVTTGAIKVLRSDADVKIEKTHLSVEADRSQPPSAYCKNADGSLLGWEYSNSGYLCIDCNFHGNVNIMSYEGNIAYCIGHHNQKSPTSYTQADKYTDIPLDSPEYSAILSAAAAGASGENGIYGLSRTDICYVTQCAIRSIVYGIPSENLAFFDADNNYNAAMTDEFRHLRQAANQPLQPKQAVLELDATGVSAKPYYINGFCYYRYGPYHPISPEHELNEYTVSYNGKASEIFASDISEPSDITQTHIFNSASSFYIFLNAKYQETVAVTITADTVVKTYSPTVYLSYDSGYQNIAQLKIYDSLINLKNEFTLQNYNTTGEIIITKKFLSEQTQISDTELISQPRFTVRCSNNQYVNGIYSNGKIIFDSFTDIPIEYSLNADNSSLCISELPIGEYFICETKGADGFYAQIPEISILNTGGTVTTDYINYQQTTASTTQTELSESSESEIITETESVTSPVTTEYIPVTENSFSESYSVPYEKITEQESTPAQTQYKSRVMLSNAPATGESSNRTIYVTFFISLSAVIITTIIKYKK